MGLLKFRKTLLVLGISAALSACGGGSDDNGGGDPVTAIEATIAGTAAKGIIIAGNVVASELNADKTVKNENVGSTVTDSEGKYSLELNDSYEGGPIKITVTASDATTMVCDVVAGCGTAEAGDPLDEDANGTTDFGERYKPSSISMTALLPEAEDGETIDIQITPFTHMAAERAMSGSTLDDDAINNANSEVSALLGGIDILTTPPVDITDLDGDESPSAVAYAALTASIAGLAPVDANGQPDIDQAVSTLAENFAAGTLAATDEGGVDTTIALQEIIDQAGDVFAEANAEDTSDVLASLQDTIDDAGEGGTIDPDPNPNAGDSNVAKAKAFLTDLRTWGVTIGAEVETPSAAFEMQLDMSDEASDMIMNDAAGNALGYGAMAIGQFFMDEIADITEFSDPDDDGSSNPFTAGTLAVNDDGDEYSLTDAVITIDEEEVTLDMTVQVPADGATGKVITLAIKNISAEDSTSQIEVTNGSIALTLESDYTIDYDAFDAETADEPSKPVKIELDFDAAFTQLKTAVVNDQGQLELDVAADPITFAATVSASLYPYSVEVTEDGDTYYEVLDVVPGSLSASGTISNTSGDSFDVSLTASIPDAATIEPVNTVLTPYSSYATNNGGEHLISWAITDADGDGDDDTFTYSHPWNDFSALFRDDGSVTVSQYDDIHEFAGPYASPTDFFYTNWWYLSDYDCCFWIDGEGEYERDNWDSPDYTQDGFIAFYLEESDLEFFDADQPLIGTAGVHFTAQFDGLPEAKVSVTGSATDFEKGNADVTISYGTRMLKFDVSNDNAAPDAEQASVEITNQDNVKLTLNVNELNDGIDYNETIDITINGVVIATITEQDDGSSKVTYIDGTFEIF